MEEITVVIPVNFTDAGRLFGLFEIRCRGSAYLRAFGSAFNAHIAVRSFMADRNCKCRYRYYRRVCSYRHRGYEPYRVFKAVYPL